MKSEEIANISNDAAQTLFRLPWTMADNAMTWLEPTRQCNMECDACFHFNDPSSDKSIEAIENELQVMLRLRKCDAMLIAGGEPLTHPKIIEITRLVKSYKCKPVIITNGVGLDDKFMRELKKAGAFGFTFHIDAHQSRTNWNGKTESEMNELRQEYAEMTYEIGGLACAFNITLFPDTLHEVPKIIDWAAKNIDKVNILTLIAVRLLHESDPWNYYAGRKRVEINDTPYVSRVKYRHINSQEIYNEIIKQIPNFRFNAFLGGTVLPNSLKWIIGTHIASKNNSYGSTGKKVMELLQIGHHFFTGKYLAYTKPRLNRKAKSMLLFSLFDKEMKKTAKRYFNSVFHSPSRIFEKLYVQTISAVQPIDILPNGEADTCDGCPNKTFWKNRLVPACQLEEYMLYGTHISMVPEKELAG